jgi:biopolymer transport protein ExbD
VRKCKRLRWSTSKMELNVRPKVRRELDLIGLINAVFLLLVFFVVTGTIQTRTPNEIELANSVEGELRPAPPDAIALSADGDWILGAGIAQPADIAAWIASKGEESPIEIWVDARLGARLFQEKLRSLDGLSGRTIKVITSRANAP